MSASTIEIFKTAIEDRKLEIEKSQAALKWLGDFPILSLDTGEIPNLVFTPQYDGVRFYLQSFDQLNTLRAILRKVLGQWEDILRGLYQSMMAGEKKCFAIYDGVGHEGLKCITILVWFKEEETPAEFTKNGGTWKSTTNSYENRVFVCQMKEQDNVVS